MAYKKVLTIQDISCVGQCSLTVALPILSACGHETCILPSAVLSTHTGGFTGFTFRDLTDDMPSIVEHWRKENISFDAIYTGYLGSIKQIGIVKNILDTMGKEKCIRVVDPAFADHGKLYSIFDLDYVEAMKSLCPSCDILVPNLSEACFLCGMEYTENYDNQFIEEVLTRLSALGCKAVLMTGISFNPEKTGVLLYENGEIVCFEHEKMAKGAHGTGDIYASAFVGALLTGRKTLSAAKIACKYTLDCIKNTQGDSTHWYGAKFEPSLPYLMKLLNKTVK